MKEQNKKSMIELPGSDLRWLRGRLKKLDVSSADYLEALRAEAIRHGLMRADDRPPVEVRQGYKLLRLRRDGTLGPLFINATQVIPTGEWLRSEYFFKKGFAFRPGWHVAPVPDAPHLGLKGRVWRAVEVADFEELRRPESQGGTWWLARWMRVMPSTSNPST